MRVVLDATPKIMAGSWAILRATSINDGAQPVAWPARLHPHESTTSFLVDGVRHRGAEQIDSIVETVLLEPGQAVSTGVLVAVGDKGPVLSASGDVLVQLAVAAPGASHETLSNSVLVSVVDPSAWVGADEAQAPLTDLHQAAVALRDGETDDMSALVTLLTSVAGRDRPWVATALLPPAPMPDDPLLTVATRLDTDADETLPSHLILGSVPYSYDKMIG